MGISKGRPEIAIDDLPYLVPGSLTKSPSPPGDPPLSVPNGGPGAPQSVAQRYYFLMNGCIVLPSGPRVSNFFAARSGVFEYLKRVRQRV